MAFRKNLVIVLVGLLALLAACSPQAGPLPDTGNEQTPVSPVGPAGSYDEFVSALQAGGATVEEAGEIEQPFFPVTGHLVRVNGADVQVFEFASEADRKAVSDTISSAGDQIGTSLPQWIGQPNFWASGRLIVLYVGQDQAIIDLLTGALGEPVTQPEESPGLPAEAVLDAQRWLAAQLGVPVQQVTIVETEQAEWTDSCLGLGGPAESCLQVITPGWRAIFEVNGKQYEVRTDESGSVIRSPQISPETGGEGELVDTRWRLVSMGETGAETPVLSDSEVTLEFEAGGEAVGSGGCNTFGTDYRVLDGILSLGNVVTTEIACLEEGVMEQEQRYYQALQSAGEFELADDQLKIWYEDGQGVLTFERVTDETPEPSPGAVDRLSNTQWALVSFGPVGSEQPVVGDATVVLQFENESQAGGDAGCNTYGGQYSVEGNTLSFESITSTLRACADERITEQEQRYYQALQSAGEFELTGDQLKIWYDNSQGVLNFERVN